MGGWVRVGGPCSAIPKIVEHSRRARHSQRLSNFPEKLVVGGGTKMQNMRCLYVTKHLLFTQNSNSRST